MAPVCGTMFKLTHDDETKYEWKQFVIIVRQKKIRKRILQHYCEKMTMATFSFLSAGLP